MITTRGSSAQVCTVVTAHHLLYAYDIAPISELRNYFVTFSTSNIPAVLLGSLSEAAISRRGQASQGTKRSSLSQGQEVCK